MGGTIHTMDTKAIHIKIYADTRKKLKLLAVMREMTMMDVADQLVSEALNAQVSNAQGNTDSLQQASESEQV